MYNPHRVNITYTAPDGSTLCSTVRNVTMEQLDLLHHLLASAECSTASDFVQSVMRDLGNKQIDAINNIHTLAEKN